MASYYVDPAIAGNSGTGTIGDPYGDLQYALDTVTQDGVLGDRFNIKAGTAEVLAAPLSLSTYGFPNTTRGLVFAGYSLEEDDGGVAEIDGNGGGIWANNTAQGVRWERLKLHNCGSALILNLSRNNSVLDCELYNTSNGAINFAQALITAVDRCIIHDIGGAGVTQGSSVTDCVFANGTKKFTHAVYTFDAGVCDRCFFLLDSSSDAVRWFSGDSFTVRNCSMLTTGTGKGIRCGNANSVTNITNNLIEGFAVGIDVETTTTFQVGPVRDNAFFNCTSNIVSGLMPNEGRGNETLASTPFAKSGSLSSFADRLTYFALADITNDSDADGFARGAIPHIRGTGGSSAPSNPFTQQVIT